MVALGTGFRSEIGGVGALIGGLVEVGCVGAHVVGGPVRIAVQEDPELREPDVMRNVRGKTGVVRKYGHIPRFVDDQLAERGPEVVGQLGEAGRKEVDGADQGTRIRHARRAGVGRVDDHPCRASLGSLVERPGSKVLEQQFVFDEFARKVVGRKGNGGRRRAIPREACMEVEQLAARLRVELVDSRQPRRNGQAGTISEQVRLVAGFDLLVGQHLPALLVEGHVVGLIRGFVIDHDLVGLPGRETQQLRDHVRRVAMNQAARADDRVVAREPAERVAERLQLAAVFLARAAQRFAAAEEADVDAVADQQRLAAGGIVETDVHAEARRRRRENK